MIAREHQYTEPLYKVYTERVYANINLLIMKSFRQDFLLARGTAVLLQMIARELGDKAAVMTLK